MDKRLKMQRGLHSPQLDAAVGPFAIEEGLIEKPNKTSFAQIVPKKSHLHKK